MNAFTPVPDVTLTLTNDQANVARRALQSYATLMLKANHLELAATSLDVNDLIALLQHPNG